MGSRKSNSQKTPKKTPPRKQKSPKGKTKISKETAAKCTEWLQSQKKIPRLDMENPEEEVQDEDSTENPSAYDKTFREMVKIGNGGDTEVLFECEWGQCRAELWTTIDHQLHIETHINEIEDEVLEGDDILACKWDLCEFDTTEKITLIRHLYVHGYHSRIKTHGASFCSSLKLPVCKMDSKQRNVAQDVKSDFFCYWADCRETFVDLQKFYAHVKLHIADDFFHRPIKVSRKKCGLVSTVDKVRPAKIFMACKWAQCDKKYDRQQQMENHAVTHTGEKVIACSNCGMKFVNKYRLVDHLKRQMEGVATHECPQCNKFFPFEKQLRTHMKCHINQVKCTLCDMTCATNSALIKHIRYRHIKERPFKCMLCDFRAVMKRDLEVHMSVHDPNFFLRCSVPGCDFACKSIETLKKHVDNHDGIQKLFACHICDETFQFGSKLTKHLIAQHDFQHPSGFQRFNYKQDDDGFYRLQMTRLESLEVSEQIVNQDEATQNSITVEPEMKRIEDFDVMKKYLQVEKESVITLEVLDQDETGRRTRKETFLVRELVPKETS